jgi:hypothetical protein
LDLLTGSGRDGGREGGSAREPGSLVPYKSRRQLSTSSRCRLLRQLEIVRPTRDGGCVFRCAAAMPSSAAAFSMALVPFEMLLEQLRFVFDEAQDGPSVCVRLSSRRSSSSLSVALRCCRAVILQLMQDNAFVRFRESPEFKARPDARSYDSG